LKEGGARGCGFIDESEIGSGKYAACRVEFVTKPFHHEGHEKREGKRLQSLYFFVLFVSFVVKSLL